MTLASAALLFQIQNESKQSHYRSKSLRWNRLHLSVHAVPV